MRNLWLLTALLFSTVTARAQNLPAGWFVIVGSYSYLSPAARAHSEGIRTLAAQCNMRTQTRSSDTMVGLPMGRVVQTIGAYRSPIEAARVRSLVSRCIPDAFVAHTVDVEDIPGD